MPPPGRKPKVINNFKANENKTKVINNFKARTSLPLKQLKSQTYHKPEELGIVGDTLVHDGPIKFNWLYDKEIEVKIQLVHFLKESPVWPKIEVRVIHSG